LKPDFITIVKARSWIIIAIELDILKF
jgi:hypothetical protein